MDFPSALFQHFDVSTLIAIFGLFVWSNSLMNKKFKEAQERTDQSEQRTDRKFETFEQKIDRKFETFEQKINRKLETFEQKIEQRMTATEMRFEYQLREINCTVIDIARRLCRIEGSMSCSDPIHISIPKTSDPHSASSSGPS